MNLKKIDKSIFEGISTQNLSKEMPCFVFANDFFAVKNRLINSKIHILDEYLFIKIFYCFASKSQIFELSDADDVSYISAKQEASSLMYIAKHILSTHKTKLSGNGIGVAFIDTGIDLHADFLMFFSFFAYIFLYFLL